MSSPEDRRYTKSHEWARAAGGLVEVGITAFAVEALQDLVFIDLPKVGTKLAAEGRFGEIESVKAVSDLYAPVAGEVVEVNGALAGALETLNRDPYKEGWMIRLKPAGDAAAAVAKLMSAKDYDAHTAAGH